MLEAEGPRGGVTHSVTGRRELPIGHSSEDVPSVLDHGHYYRHRSGDRRRRRGLVAVARGGGEAVATVTGLRGRRGRRRRGCEVVGGGSAGVGRGGGVAAVAGDAPRPVSAVGVPMAELLDVLAVQPFEGVHGVQDLLLRHAAPTQTLQQVNLLDGKARLICIMGHSAGREREERVLTALKN